MAQVSLTFYLWRIAVAAALVLALPLRAQTAEVGVPPQDLETALHQMADRADVIFVGRVTAVRQHDGGGVGSGFVEVQFAVDQAVRGCTASSPYTLREWAGLWAGGDQRYRVGEPLLMLLHAPGASGMSSPVDGLDGAIPIMRGGSTPLVSGSSVRQAPPAVDLRWVGVKMLHPVVYRTVAKDATPTVLRISPPVAQAAMVPGATAGMVRQVAPIVAASTESGAGSVPSQQASVDAVVGMLTSWQKVQHAGR